MRVRIVGAGIVGLTAAFELARRGVPVDVYEKREAPGLGCSYYAGGMIAPWCEREASEQIVTDLGLEALDFWTKTVPMATVTGSLVVAPPRDRSEVVNFSRRASHFEECNEKRIGEIEPDLSGRFPYGLFFPNEAYLEPRAATKALTQALASETGVTIHCNVEAPERDDSYDWTIDSRGFDAKPSLTGLRGVSGEMLVLRTREISLSRPVRMLHPRRPVYIVPRPDHEFMIGATMIETETRGRVTARSMMELLGSAYTLHPAFGEAEIVEVGGDVRPTFSENLPRLRARERTLYINGLYRHGFLLSPALARRAADYLIEGRIFPELMDEYPGERAIA